MAFEENFDQFLDLADFAEPMEWNNVTFNGIFDNDTYRVDGENSVPVDLQKPTVMIKTSDTAGMSQGDPILRVEPNVPYTIETIAPDGTGMSILGLAASGPLADRVDALQRNRQQRQQQRQGQQ